MTELPSFPFEISPDPFDKKEGAKSGYVIHKNYPHFKCRFEFCNELPEETGAGLTTYNVDTGVFLSELELQGDTKLSAITEISKSMKNAASAIDYILRLKI